MFYGYNKTKVKLNFALCSCFRSNRYNRDQVQVVLINLFQLVRHNHIYSTFMLSSYTKFPAGYNFKTVHPI